MGIQTTHMKHPAILSTLRLWLTAMIAAALFCTPVYAEIETVTPVVDMCDLQTIEVQSSSPSDKTETPTHEGHDTHNHTCGACHVHIFKSIFPTYSFGISTSNTLWPAIVPAALRASPLGLFRPPRH